MHDFKPYLFVAFLLCCMLNSFTCLSQRGNNNRNITNNGLSGNLFVHDPVMTRQDSVYYIFSTGKGISIKRSNDRIQWESAGRVFDSLALPAWHRIGIPGQDGSLWAPDIHYSNGRYQLYYSVSVSRPKIGLHI